MNKRSVKSLLLEVFAAGVLMTTIIFAGRNDHEHFRKEHRVIRIGLSNIFPSQLRIGTGDAPTWVNLSDNDAEIIFRKDVVPHIHCKQPVNFHLASNGQLVSGWISKLGNASLCSFEPGTYNYTVRSRAVAGSEPAQQLKGKIIVKG